jgi:integrase/recombinase XerD
MDRASRVRVTGPLAPCASEFQGQLLALNYTPASAAAHLILMSQLSRWLEAQRLAPRFLTTALFERFLIDNRAQGHRFPKSARGAQLLVTFLRKKGIVPEAPAAALSPTEEVLERFRRYLVNERGLADGTIFNHLHAAKLFFNSLDGDISAHLDKLGPPSVRRFILAESRCRSVASTKCLVSGLRSLLRFLHVDGTTDISLAGAVPTVAGWTGTWLPRGVDPESVHCLLASCDRAHAQGRRDYAVLKVLTRLAMRLGEVAALELGDVDWFNGDLVVRGKARRVERLPLPPDVGEALADYMRDGRPSSEHRELFLRVMAPHQGLTRGGLIVVVRSACVRAGLAPVAAHRLRHTVASDLLRAGAGLPEIGQLLRHRSMASTAIYAKVDTVRLRQLARPWPGALA